MYSSLTAKHLSVVRSPERPDRPRRLPARRINVCWTKPRPRRWWGLVQPSLDRGDCICTGEGCRQTLHADRRIGASAARSWRRQSGRIPFSKSSFFVDFRVQHKRSHRPHGGLTSGAPCRETDVEATRFGDRRVWFSGRSRQPRASVRGGTWDRAAPGHLRYASARRFQPPSP